MKLRLPESPLAFGALVSGSVLLLFFGTCAACQKSNAPKVATAPSASASVSALANVPGPLPARVADAAALRDPGMWARAGAAELDGGADEDLSTLAVHEGAIGLVEAAEQDPALRKTALRAMGRARGWAHGPFLVKVATAKDDAEAKLALESLAELGARTRRAEDVEDFEELAAACEGLVALAKDTKKGKERRVPAIRAVRMMPCRPPLKAELPTDLDAR